MTDSFNDDSFNGAAPDDRRLVSEIRQKLDQSCNALDGHTLSRLNRIRHAALQQRHARTSRLWLPFGGFATACLLVVSVMNFGPWRAPEGEAVAAPLEDIDILTSSDSIDLYEDYEFYQWLAENDSPV